MTQCHFLPSNLGSPTFVIIIPQIIRASKPTSPLFPFSFFLLIIKKQMNSGRNDAWFSADLRWLTFKLDYTEYSLLFPHIPSEFPSTSPHNRPPAEYFGCDLWLAASHCSQDQKLETNMQLSKHHLPGHPILMMLAENQLSLRLLPLYPIWLKQDQKFREGGRMGSVSWLATGIGVKVIGSPHSALQILPCLWHCLSYMAAGRRKAELWERAVMRIEPGLLECSSSWSTPLWLPLPPRPHGCT